MGRPRHRSKEEILKAALELYWQRGPGGVTVQALESATGVNKSGLYAEFRDKDALFAATVKYYAERAERLFYPLLETAPLGRVNIQNFMLEALQVSPESGCFLTNCQRDFNQLPKSAQKVVRNHFNKLRELFIRNLSADLEEVDAEIKADILLTFDQGVCLRSFAGEDKERLKQSIESVMTRI